MAGLTREGAADAPAHSSGDEVHPAHRARTPCVCYSGMFTAWLPVRKRQVSPMLAAWKNVVTFYVLRGLLAPLWEALILLDRLLYLRELGCTRTNPIKHSAPSPDPRIPSGTVRGSGIRAWHMPPAHRPAWRMAGARQGAGERRASNRGRGGCMHLLMLTLICRLESRPVPCPDAANLVPLFDPIISPRSYGLVAIKPTLARGRRLSSVIRGGNQCSAPVSSEGVAGAPAANTQGETPSAWSVCGECEWPDAV